MAASNNSMDWDKLKVFHAAAEAGSFTHAGERLGLSQSAVSRQVSALESELSVSLFHRHARGLELHEHVVGRAVEQLALFGEDQSAGVAVEQ